MGGSNSNLGKKNPEKLKSAKKSFLQFFEAPLHVFYMPQKIPKPQ